MRKNLQESITGFKQLNPTIQKSPQTEEKSTKASVEGFNKLNPINNTSNQKK